MNVRTILLWGILATLLLQPACQNPTEPDNKVTSTTTHVRGTVMRNDNLAPVLNAVVYDVGGLARDTSKTNGSFDLVYELLSQTKTQIIGSRSGFGNDTATVTLNPGFDTTIVLRLKADSTSPGGATSSGKAANIVLVSSSAENISIRGTGANETAVLVFEVRDSLGVPIGGSNKLTVTFKITGGPNGEEYLFPASAETDPLTGRVSTRVSSGTKAGVLQVIAQATVPGTTTVIKSSPVRITISGGLPVQERFSVSRLPLNIAGGVYDNLRAKITVIMGDKEGNPVQLGTAVSFTTSGGIIQPNAVTNNDGIATVDLISGNPRPANSVAVVTAKTIGDSGKIITADAHVLFSGPTRILTPATTVVIPDSGVASFEYRVQDQNGFPLVAGTNVSLSVEGAGASELELFGDVTKTLDDQISPTTTLFKASVRDKKLKGPSGDVTFKVRVTSQNGNETVTFPGFVLADTSAAPPVFTPSKSGYASSLTLVSISTPEVSIRGTGANETARVTFVAKDSIGVPVELQRRALVSFSMSPVGGVGGGEFLYPVSDSTDAAGQVGTTFSSGTRSGVLQVVARAVVNGRIITSSPVRLTISQGLPDARYFTATVSPSSILSWPSVAGALVATVTVQVGDRYGNPVQPNTALYFSTNAGVIQPKALTDANGMASVSLFGGNPYPQGDSAQISVQTVGDGGVSIMRTLSLYVTSTYRSGLASSLTLLSSGESQLSVRGTGTNETSTVTFVAKDSAGNLLDEKRRIYVSFSISPTGGIGGGEFVSPSGGYTDSLGQVRTTFSSGVRSGVVQVVATANLPDRTITASSGRLTISGGFPDAAKLTATLSRANMPGIARSGPVGSLSVQLGDKFGNPVQTGTALSFSSTGGLIQPYAQTDVNGLATVTLQGGNPLPNDPVLGPGYGKITLQTIGEGGTSISQVIQFLFSGAPRVTLQNVPTDTIRLFDGASVDVDYTVADQNGNPISKDHVINVRASGQGAPGVTLSGDINVTTPDTQDKTNFTRYRFRVADNVTNGGPSGEFIITITVAGESGDFVRKFYGVLHPPEIATTVPPSARIPSQISFLGITNSDIYVAGVGNTENTVVTYEVRDSLGVPIDKSRRVGASYSMLFYPNSIVGGGTPPRVIPSADSTDDSGKLRTAIASGSQAGVIQISARITLPGGATIVSQPVKVTVHAGFPDRSHFTFRTSRYVFPGLDRIYVGAPTAPVFTVVVGDTFSNPVQKNTAVYFHSQAGVIATGTIGVSGNLSSYTDDKGIAGSTLITANPLPLAIPFYDPAAGSGRLGYHWAYAQTQGKGGQSIIDSVLLVWTAGPIQVTGVPATTLGVPVAGGSTPPITIDVTDRNGNPLPDGSRVTATVLVSNPPTGWSIRTSLSSTIPNAGYARFPGPGITSFTFTVTNASAGGTVSVGQTYPVEITIASELETVTRYFYIELQ